MHEKLPHTWVHIPRWVVTSAGALAVVATAAYGAAGYYLSSQVLKPANQTVQYDQKVQEVTGDSIRTQGSAYGIDGQVGLVQHDRVFVGRLGPPTDSNTDTQESTRTFMDPLQSVVRAGDNVSLQGNIWTSDPMQALGVPFRSVEYKGPLGDMEAWVIPGQQSDVWTIGVHGIGAPRSELLRFVRPVLDSGNTMMAITYRNDADTPKSPDGFTHLGDTEWEDLHAAVAYAKTQGATKINLYGVSLGGSVVQNYLRRADSKDTAIIDKVILDSPALDWKELLTHRVKQRGYPGWQNQVLRCPVCGVALTLRGYQPSPAVLPTQPCSYTAAMTRVSQTAQANK